MYTIGIRDSFSFYGTGKINRKGYWEPFLALDVDITVDYFSGHDLNVLGLKTLTEAYLEENIHEGLFKPKSSLKYIRYDMVSRDQLLYISRLRSNERLLMDFDTLLAIFDKAIAVPESFFLYYVPDEVHSRLYSYLKDVKNNGFTSTSIPPEMLNELIRLNLVVLEEEILQISHKAKVLFR